jgi:hypothetical protein
VLKGATTMDKGKLQEYIDSKIEDGGVEYQLVATVDGSIVYDGVFSSTDSLIENGVRKAENATKQTLEADYQYEEAERN